MSTILLYSQSAAVSRSLKYWVGSANFGYSGKVSDIPYLNAKSRLLLTDKNIP